MQNPGIAQRKHLAGCRIRASLSSPGRVDAHPERKHQPTPRRSLVRYHPGYHADTSAVEREVLAAGQRLGQTTQRRHYPRQGACRAAFEARRRVIRAELDKLSAQLSGAQPEQLGTIKSRSRKPPRWKAITVSSSSSSSLSSSSSSSSSSRSAYRSNVRPSSRILSPSISTLPRNSMKDVHLSPMNRTSSVESPAARLIAEDRPNCRLCNNGIDADAGHTFTGARVGSREQVWFRPNLAPDSHSPPPALARSARPGALAIVEMRSSGTRGHIRRIGITDRADVLSPTLGLSARKKDARARLAKQRKQKAPRLRSLTKALPA